MKGDSRIKKSILNAKVNTVCYFVSLIAGFFSRKIFLDYLGESFLGLSSTFGSLLGFLNIAELGISVAISYVLYKPLSESNKTEINKIISVLGYMYRIIGHVILIVGIILSLFLPLIFKGVEFGYLLLYLGFYSYLFSSLIGYYINYKQILLSADQRNYEVTGYYQMSSLIILILQMFLAVKTGNYVIFFLLQLLLGVLYAIILEYRVRRVYPWLHSEIRKGYSLLSQYPEIISYIKKIFIHKISSFVQFQLSPLLIYSFVSLPMVALYTNYTTVIDKFQRLVSNVLDSSFAGVGNLISEGDSNKIWEVYRQLFSFRLFIVGVTVLCFYYFIDGLIELWLGDKYLLSNSTVILMNLSMFLFLLRGTTDQFIMGYGLFNDVWAAVIETIIFLLASIFFGYLWGLNGVLMGPLISSFIIAHLWKPYYLFKKGFKRNISDYVYFTMPLILGLIINILMIVYIIRLIDFSINSWVNLILYSILFSLIDFLLLFCCYFIISKSFRSVIGVLYKKIISK